MDRREAILARLEIILSEVGRAPDGDESTVDPFLVVYRNRAQLPADKRPAAVLLDGSEVSGLSYGKPLRTQNIGPQMMELRPQIFIVLRVRSLEESVEYGPEISAYRMAVLNLLCNDAELHDLIGANGRIDLRGVDTDMQTGASLQGQLQLNLGIRYPLSPKEM